MKFKIKLKFNYKNGKNWIKIFDNPQQNKSDIQLI